MNSEEEFKVALTERRIGLILMAIEWYTSELERREAAGDECSEELGEVEVLSDHLTGVAEMVARARGARPVGAP